MNIRDMLNEVDKEIVRITSNYRFDKADKTKDSDYMIYKLNKVKSSFGILKKGIIELESHSNFVEKIKIKKDLKDLIKLIKSEYSKKELKAPIIKYTIDKLNVKYNLRSFGANKSNKINTMFDVISTETEEEFYKSLQERIAKSHQKVQEQKSKNGIKCDEPVQIISLSEVKEVAERARRIEHAKAEVNKKRALLQKQQENEMRATIGIREKVKSIIKRKHDRELGSMHEEKPSFSNKLKLRKADKNCKNTSTVIEDKKKLPWYATIPVVGALAIAAISGGTEAFNNNTNRDNEDLSSKNNSYSDSVNPGQAEVTEVSTTETTRLDKTTVSSNTTEFNITTSTTNSAKKQNQTTTKPEQSEKNDESIVINIGDKINVSAGLEYTANCLGGGNSNKIGNVSWRPPADYSVDKVAFCHNGKVLGIMESGEGDVKQTLNNYAKQYEIDADQINTSVLLSLVPGSGDTGWAQISIEDMEKNISKPIQNLDNGIQTHASFELDR